MFDADLFWKLLEEKSEALGSSLGLTGSISRDPIGRKVTLRLGAKLGAYGKRWDDRVWELDFDSSVLWRIATAAVPERALERPTRAMMEHIIDNLVRGRRPEFELEPDGKWEPVAADAVITFVACAMLPDVRRELEARPLKQEPGPKLVQVSEDGQMAYFEWYDGGTIRKR